MPDVPYHAWTHRPKAQGGTDPLPGFAGEYAWMDKTTDTTIGTGSVSVIASYNTGSSDSSTFDVDASAGYIYLLRTGIYAVSCQLKWTVDPAPGYVAVDVSSSVEHPFDTTSDIATFQQYGPTGFGSIGPFRMSAAGTVAVVTLSGTSTNNYVRVRAGQESGSDKTLDTVSLLVVRLFDV